MHVEIRRATGGLRLFFREPAAPQWSARLPYPRAGQLIEAINGACPCSVPEFRYEPLAAGEATLVCGASEVLLDALDVETLRDSLRAHMPDRMRPLPG
ncbi:hypothetical protein [Lentzea sp. NBRC 105346]|uniref:hypothetical protein n=1 Tax=Lentzea sp. NBRC 105346 TaxID=3032205 RepID=UPI00255701AD|nr:hypothetical protein [Lentzea sp. NBRC 105346]